MAKTTKETTFTENDIIFECPYCSKSMAIDKRGMGLTINCPDCDGLVRVPTVSEATSGSPDSVNMPVEGLADALHESRDEIQELRAKMEELNQLREKLEQQTATQEQKLGELRREFGNIQAALDRVSLVMVDENDS
jgi:predicted  nucleic acid-binding Zn-ribbon protein